LYQLLNEKAQEYLSPTKGTLGGHKRNKTYGRMNCSAADRALKAPTKDVYVRNRVFFADETTAIAAGYRPCGTCMRDEYRVWKAAQD
jgi:hypothetical protein